MKRLVVSILCVTAGVSVLAQTKKPVPASAATHKAAAGTASSPVVLKTVQDSINYSIGLSVANFYKQMNGTNVNTALITRAINDVMKNKAVMNNDQANMCIQNYVQRLQVEKSAGNKKAGLDFLAANKNKPGVVTLPSGLQYQIIKAGTGPKPTVTDKVKVHYHGTLIDGRVFDSSVERGEPIELSVGGVIRGWTEALQLMPVGSKWKLFIPSDLGYGDNQMGPLIAPGSTLIFDVELLDIVKGTPPANSSDSTNH